MVLAASIDLLHWFAANIQTDIDTVVNINAMTSNIGMRKILYPEKSICLSQGDVTSITNSETVSQGNIFSLMTLGLLTSYLVG